MREFSHIEIRLVRNEEWLKKKLPFFLSEWFPIADFDLPRQFEDMTETDLSELKKWIIERLEKHLDLRPPCE